MGVITFPDLNEQCPFLLTERRIGFVIKLIGAAGRGGFLNGGAIGAVANGNG